VAIAIDVNATSMATLQKTASTTSPYDVTVTAQPLPDSSSDCGVKRTTSPLPSPGHSSSSPSNFVPIPCAYNHSSLGYDPSAPPPYAETLQPTIEDDAHVTRKEEQERKRGMKAYALEISRIVGKQLKDALKGNQKAHAIALQQSQDAHANALRDAKKVLDQAANVAEVRRDSFVADGGRRR
jgi:hypothetical protein